MRHAAGPGKLVLMIVVVLAGAGFFAQAQTDQGTPPTGGISLDESDLEQLVAPIALYPDPLLAQVLPGSTYPLEIQSAANWLQANPNPSEAAIDSQAVEPPIKALLHYPAVLTMMNDKIDWTQQLGIAFVNQQSDVMNAIQQLRARAQSAGTLVSGPQQQVMQDDNGIEIVPADDNVMYVPQYDPDAVYIGDGAPGYITYGAGYPCGIWLNFDFDWHNRHLGEGRGWNHGWAWHHDHHPGEIHPWERDRAKPLPLMHPDAWRNNRPGYETRTVHPAPGAFGGYGRGADVQRSEEQARHERVAPQPHEAPRARPEPAPRPQPQPREEPRARQAPPAAFHAEGNGRAAAAQSARGHASSGGGGGGGGRHR